MSRKFDRTIKKQSGSFMKPRKEYEQIESRYLWTRNEKESWEKQIFNTTFYDLLFKIERTNKKNKQENKKIPSKYINH